MTIIRHCYICIPVTVEAKTATELAAVLFNARCEAQDSINKPRKYKQLTFVGFPKIKPR